MKLKDNAKIIVTEYGQVLIVKKDEPNDVGIFDITITAETVDGDRIVVESNYESIEQQLFYFDNCEDEVSKIIDLLLKMDAVNQVEDLQETLITTSDKLFKEPI